MNNQSPQHKLLSDIYYNAKLPGSFTGVRKLYENAKLQDKSVTLKVVKNFLDQQKTYQLHRTQRYRFPRRKFIAKGLNELWGSDLADMASLSWHNNGVKWLLGIVDIFSRFAYVIPLKNKEAETIVEAFRHLFTQITIRPRLLVTDSGSEYINKQFKKLLADHNIRSYVTLNTEIKVAHCERFWKTLKSKLFKHMTANNTKRHIDVLQSMVDSYNQTRHSAIGMAPADVSVENEAVVRRRLYPPINYYWHQGQI